MELNKSISKLALPWASSGLTVLLLISTVSLDTSAQSYPAVGSTPSANQNYVLIRTFRVPLTPAELGAPRTIAQENQTIRYFDGLGRPIQNVQLKGSPTFTDVVTHMQYDGLGRQLTDYLPYAEQTSADGSFKTTAQANLLAYYGSGSWDAHVKKTTAPFAVSVVEASPTGRILEQGFPGAVWQPAASRSSSSGRTLTNEYGVNQSADVSVKRWEVSGSTLFVGGNYFAGTLSRHAIRDENWMSGKAGSTEVFTDMLGREVLVRRWKSGSEPLDTYYVYDAYGILRYVVPPGVTANTLGESDPQFTSYVYVYRYDQRRRVSQRKIPGKDWEYVVYDRNDRPILTQDGVQRAASPMEWTYTKYDAHGRIAQTGIHKAYYADQAAAQSAANSYAAGGTGRDWESRSGSGYTNVAFPTSGLTPLYTAYYDNYTFTGASDPTLAPTSITPSVHTQGMMTGRLVYRDDGTAPMLEIHYYDDYGQIVQTASQNHLGGVDRFTHTYTFSGELTSTVHVQSVAGGPSVTVETAHSYDHQGRLLDTRKKVNTQPEYVESRLAYNQIGQLRQQQLHSTSGGSSFAGTVDFSYNERGWLTKSASAHFTQELRYNQPTAGATAQYNGNISEQHWGHSSSIPNRFLYSYDPLDRLISGISSTSAMSEVLAYDNMGNITSLTRDGGTPISYSYSGNRLTALSGGISGSYSYDVNGNALTDRSGLSYTYNHLNLPKTATKTGTSVSYSYDALGTKLRSQGALAPAQVQDYVQGLEYTGGTLTRMNTQQGYIAMDGPSPVPHYYMSDHLGNVRAVLTPSGSSFAAIQQQDYYPYGLRKALAGAAENFYLYNGKELQGELGGQYDYGARMMDPVIGRWNVPDPLGAAFENVSPYAYVENNPVLFLDPTGMYRVDANGNITIDNPDEISKFLHFINSSQNITTEAMANHVISADKGFTWELDAVSVTGKSAFASGGWLGDAQNRVSDAVGQMGNINSVSTSHLGFENTRSALDVGGGMYRVFNNALAPRNQWLGQNGRYYSTSWGGNQHTGSRSAALRAAANYRWAARSAGFASVVVGGVETYRGYQMDGGQFGYNAQRAAAGSAGGLVGGWAGAKVGASVGFGIGAWFGGVGAVPGALIGGFVGGLSGGYAGSRVGERSINYYHGR